MQQKEWQVAAFGRDVQVDVEYCDRCRCEILMPFLNKGNRYSHVEFKDATGNVYKDLCVSCFQHLWQRHESERYVLKMMYGSTTTSHDAPQTQEPPEHSFQQNLKSA